MTPLKDEMPNIERFINSLSRQTYKIKQIVIVENDSIDGSKEFLQNLKKIKNVENVKIIHLTFEDKTYDLELKYAAVVSEALNYLKSTQGYKEYDYIGILDSDCFPEETYFEKIVSFLEENKKIGIASGVAYTPEGKAHIANKNWVRGGFRLWRRECLDQTGFPIIPSPDTITVALAQIRGWQTKTRKDAIVITREVNDRMQDYKNFGRRAYYRGHTPFFAIIKSFDFIIVKRKFKIGIDYLRGYFNDYFLQKQRIPIKEVRRYYKFYLINSFNK
ncbi:MAG: glycosyltransferase family 2 protein [Flavobacteriaceae bacterium]|nr:glycosyltransferase family 2 protein [Flavobacteriaceae bacterium]